MNNNSKWNKTGRRLIYIAAAAVLWAILVFVFDFFPEQEKELRQEIRNAVERTFPQQMEELAKIFGLTYYGEESAESPIINTEAPAVVLIHGLDDPGKVWMNLALELAAKNFNVWELRYPNDQPIVESAQFFYTELKRLPALGISQVSIVAHSKGGLVSREMLTSPKLNYNKAARAGDMPKVTALIMVGTPNHGSEMARFRALSEIREQWTKLIKGEWHILSAIADGAGEAKIDLLPESQFLQTLNKRPHPEAVKMLSIAGIATPWDQADIDQLHNTAQEILPASAHQTLAELEASLQSMSNGLGDGLVTVESTRLDGIEHRSVNGTHLSMIRNVLAESDRIPPAVPVIIKYLEQNN